MKILPIKDIDTAVRIYYAFPEIGNKEIRELFGNICSSTISKYKKAVQDVQTKNNIVTAGLNTVDTETAFTVWGLDIKDLERRRKKLKELGLSA